MVLHDDDLAFRFSRELLDFLAEIVEVGFVLLHVLLHGPVLDVVKVHKAGAYKVLLRRCDAGEERAAENCHGGREVVARLVEQDKFSGGLILGGGLEREK